MFCRASLICFSIAGQCLLSLCLFWVNQRCEHFLLQIAKPLRLPGRAGSSCQPAAGRAGGVTPSSGLCPARSCPRSCRQRAPSTSPHAAQAAAVASKTPVVGSKVRHLHRQRQPRESKTRRGEAPRPVRASASALQSGFESKAKFSSVSPALPFVPSQSPEQEEQGSRCAKHDT